MAKSKKFNSIYDDEIRAALHQAYEGLKKFHELTGMEYDDNGEYALPNVKANEIEDNPELHDLFESISCAYADIGYYMNEE